MAKQASARAQQAEPRRSRWLPSETLVGVLLILIFIAAATLLILGVFQVTVAP